MELVKIKKVIEAGGGFAVLLGNTKKTFPIFVGSVEGDAMLRELRGCSMPRPMTHDLLALFMKGFDVEIKKILISSLVDNTFFATLVLQQKIVGENGEWTGRRNEVRVDARPSDCLVLALKERLPIWVADEVFGAVTDAEDLLVTGHKQISTQTPFFEVDDDLDFDLDFGDPEGEREL